MFPEKMRKAFTLMEIIIVIVIIGVLATLALPKITGQVEAVRAGEALAMLGSIKRAADQCYEASKSMSSCNTFAKLGITNPNGLFSYTSDVSGGTLLVNAIRSGATAPAVPASVCLSFDGDTGTLLYDTKPAGSPYESIVVKTQSSGVVAGCGAAMPQNMLL
jgi:prepilin-type N-terminal cleavage/methylation domain-containing protein